jgi:exodeoxyribonuclease V alpha subunit
MMGERVIMSLEVIEGSVSIVTYYNAETGYCVLRIEPAVGMLPVTVVGVMPEVQVGEFVKIEGGWDTHSKYGRQFKAQHMTRTFPVTEEGIKRYLGSGLIWGIRGRTADKIVDALGTDTIEILNSTEAFHRLSEIKGVGRHRAGLIVEAWAEQREIADVMMFLQEYRVGTALSLKIYKFYKDQDLSPIQVLQEDPYQLTRDIHGVGFKTADRIAQNLGLPTDSPGRMQAALIYAMESAVSDGHIYLPEEEAIKRAAELLEITAADALNLALEVLLRNGNLKADNLQDGSRTIYQPPLFYSERGSARVVRRLLENQDSKLYDKGVLSMNSKDWDTLLNKASRGGVTLADQQREAVKMALKSKLSILTGGPGTGKTTTLRTIIAALDHFRCEYLLASPTGRAAKRLSQATERPAQTIHRLLGYNFSAGFEHNENNPLHGDFMIIDETSMLDIHLFYALLRALPYDCHLLLVGDVDQLPSVGAGDVLRDLIRAEICPVTRLNVIFRQGGGSLIVENAHRINQGESPILDNQGSDFFFFGKEDPNEAAELLVDVVKNRIPQKFGYDPIADVQVLSPMYRTPVGVEALNTALQEALNPPGRPAEKQLGGQLLRVGDKVIQTRNNYELGVYNGDIGIIHSFDFEKRQITVIIEADYYTYGWLEADQLSLAYACSVHRAQGSEYPVVVIPVMTQHYMMLQRNLLYTAVTRARKLVVLVGMRKAISMAVKNNQVAERYTALDTLLKSNAL